MGTRLLGSEPAWYKTKKMVLRFGDEWSIYFVLFPSEVDFDNSKLTRSSYPSSLFGR